MTKYTLTFTEHEAEILGYALAKAKAYCKDNYANAKPGSAFAADMQNKAIRIEALRGKLDTCPAD